MATCLLILAALLIMAAYTFVAGMVFIWLKTRICADWEADDIRATYIMTAIWPFMFVYVAGSLIFGFGVGVCEALLDRKVL